MRLALHVASRVIEGKVCTSDESGEEFIIDRTLHGSQLHYVAPSYITSSQPRYVPSVGHGRSG